MVAINARIEDLSVTLRMLSFSSGVRLSLSFLPYEGVFLAVLVTAETQTDNDVSASTRCFL